MGHHDLDDIPDFVHTLVDVEQCQLSVSPVVAHHLSTGNLLGRAPRVRYHVQMQRNARGVLEEALQQQLVLALQHRRRLCVYHKQVVGRGIRSTAPPRGYHPPAALVPLPLMAQTVTAAPRAHHGVVLLLLRQEGLAAAGRRAEEVGKVVDVGIEDEEESH